MVQRVACEPARMKHFNHLKLCQLMQAGNNSDLLFTIKSLMQSFGVNPVTMKKSCSRRKSGRVEIPPGLGCQSVLKGGVGKSSVKMLK